MLLQRTRYPRWRWHLLILWKEMMKNPTGMLQSISLKSVTTKHQDWIRQIEAICSARTPSNQTVEELPTLGYDRLNRQRNENATKQKELPCIEKANPIRPQGRVLFRIASWWSDKTVCSSFAKRTDRVIGTIPRLMGTPKGMTDVRRDISKLLLNTYGEQSV